MSYTLVYIPSASNCNVQPGQHSNLGQNMDEAEAVEAAFQDVVHRHAPQVMEGLKIFNAAKATTHGELLCLLFHYYMSNIAGFYAFYNRFASDYDIQDEYIFVNAEKARSCNFNPNAPIVAKH
jgi:hypothetical protein